MKSLRRLLKGDTNYGPSSGKGSTNFKALTQTLKEKLKYKNSGTI